MANGFYWNSYNYNDIIMCDGESCGKSTINELENCKNINGTIVDNTYNIGFCNIHEKPITLPEGKIVSFGYYPDSNGVFSIYLNQENYNFNTTFFNIKAIKYSFSVCKYTILVE